MNTRIVLLAAIVAIPQMSLAQPAPDHGDPKVTITNIGFNSPDAEGFFSAGVSLQSMTCVEHIPVYYNLAVNHVKLVSEVKERIRPQIEAIERDLAKDCDHKK